MVVIQAGNNIDISKLLMRKVIKIEKNIINFLNKPFSNHTLETLKVLNKLRSTSNNGKYCLICIKPFEIWQLAKLTGQRGKPAVPIKNKYFTNLEEAERYVFTLRWKSINKI